MSHGPATERMGSDSDRGLRSTRLAPARAPARRSSGHLPHPQARVGEWELLGELGRGAMGVVYRARHPRLPEREVALKLIAGTVDDEVGRQRFQREGEALARLDHPNVVRVHAAGLLPDDRPYLVMELIRGKTLQDLADEVGMLPVDEAAELIEPVARAVAHMHERDVLHRDLKLANVELDPEGRVVVMDFGLANLTDRRTRLTISQEILGTPLYMAPEVMREGNSSAPQEDVYAIGVMLFRLTTGRYPFYANSLDRLFKLIENALLDFPDGFDPSMAEILKRCLAKRPRDRYPSAVALAEDLAALRRGEVIAPIAVSSWSVITDTIERRRVPLFGALFILAVGLLTAIGIQLSLPPQAVVEPAPVAAVDPADAQRRADLLAKAAALTGVPSVETLRGLRQRFDQAPTPIAPLTAVDRRFLATHALLAYLHGDEAQARAVLSRAVLGRVQDDAALETLEANLRGLLTPASLPRLVASSLQPDRLLAQLDHLRDTTTPETNLTRGLLQLRLGWPAAAARSFQRAIDRLGPWPAWLAPVSFRIRATGARRALPIGLAAQVGLAQAHALLLDPGAARATRERAAAHLNAMRQTDAAGELATLETHLPRTAPAFLTEAETELETFRAWPRWLRTRQLSAASRGAAATKAEDAFRARELLALNHRLGLAERALRLASRQGAPAQRVAVARGWIALWRKNLLAADEQLRLATQHARDAWQVQALAAQVRIAQGETAPGIAFALKAAERLASARLHPVARAAKRYEILLENYEALRDSKTTTTLQALAILEPLAQLTRAVPLAPTHQVEWLTELIRIADGTGNEPLLKRARADLAAAQAELTALATLSEEIRLELRAVAPEQVVDKVLDLRKRSPAESSPYLFPFSRSGPRRLDELTQAFLIEPMYTLLTLAKDATPANWSDAKKRARATDALARPFDRRLPHPPDPDLRRALFLFHDLQLRHRTSPAERAAALEALARYRARLPWSRAGVLLSGLLKLELGDPGGAVTDLLRAELLGPLVSGKKRLTIVYLHYHLARAHAALGQTDKAVHRLQQGIARGPYLTPSYLIDDEPRFRDPTDPSRLRPEYQPLKALQQRTAAQYRRPR